jgi:hypothetical protein
MEFRISEWFCIPKSIKTTTIKPSGSVSLLAGGNLNLLFLQYYIAILIELLRLFFFSSDVWNALP